MGVAQSQRWIEDITRNWEFKRIIPAHFAAPVPATPRDLRCMRFVLTYLRRQSSHRGMNASIRRGMLSVKLTLKAVSLDRKPTLGIPMQGCARGHSSGYGLLLSM